jgi:Holliday junction DNA helicase RuvA
LPPGEKFSGKQFLQITVTLSSAGRIRRRYFFAFGTVLPYTRFTLETMIGFLSGKILEKDANTVIVDVAGVGYEVTIPLSTFYELGDVGSDVSLRIFTHVREDALQLFGFKTTRERDLYLKLISVQGIGAKSGITMLSGMSADEIVTAIRTNNLVRLTSIPGVGKKTAERMVIELRDKIGDISAGAAAGVSPAGAGASPDSIFDDALSALVNLGYQRNAAEKALQDVAKDGAEMNVQKLLRGALQKLAR